MMNFSNLIKDKIIPVIVVGSLIFLIYYLKDDDSLEPKEIVYGKIIDFKIAANIQTYYIYQFRFKNIIFQGSYLVGKIDKNNLNKCFEIIVNINNPNNNKLILDKEVNCSLAGQLSGEFQ